MLRLRRHHQASAGGSSTSKLQTSNPKRWTPPGFSRWFFNFKATNEQSEEVDTTRLQPVVLQLQSYKRAIRRGGHHQASAGGSSTSKLQTSNPKRWTPPGFSRWFFNFKATNEQSEEVDTTRLQPVVLQLQSYKRAIRRGGHHQASAGGSSTSKLQTSNPKRWTPPGFSRWFFNFKATNEQSEEVDTTRLQPVVLQLQSYKRAIRRGGHHQASAGGSSTSKLQTSNPKRWTPPGFSRWFFNFKATNEQSEEVDTTRLQPVVLQLQSYKRAIRRGGHHQASAGGT